MEITDLPKLSKEEYLMILELCFEVTESLNGKISEDGRKPDCQGLALKLYSHGASAYWLSLGTRAPVPKSKGGSSFIDPGSIAVLARSAIETYLTFFEVFIAPEFDDEFEFNYCLWHLSGNVVKEGVVPTDPSMKNEYEAAQEEISQLRKRIQQTVLYSSLKDNQKKEVLRGKIRREWENVAKTAGFSQSFLRRIYAYCSSYVHADGLSASQLMSIQSRESQDFFSSVHLTTILIMLSKMILNYAGKFPEANGTCKLFPYAYQRAEAWARVVETAK